MTKSTYMIPTPISSIVSTKEACFRTSISLCIRSRSSEEDIRTSVKGLVVTMENVWITTKTKRKGILL